MQQASFSISFSLSLSSLPLCLSVTVASKLSTEVDAGLPSSTISKQGGLFYSPGQQALCTRVFSQRGSSHHAKRLPPTSPPRRRAKQCDILGKGNQGIDHSYPFQNLLFSVSLSLSLSLSSKPWRCSSLLPCT